MIEVAQFDSSIVKLIKCLPSFCLYSIDSVMLGVIGDEQLPTILNAFPSILPTCIDLQLGPEQSPDPTFYSFPSA